MPAIENALKNDLGKSPEESYLTEIQILLDEIHYQVSHLKRWSKPKLVKSGLALFPSKSQIVLEPYGLVLIIAPWNYPFQLLLNPLIGAIAAGNCAVVKPSNQALHTAVVSEKIIQSVFDRDYVRVVRGDRAELDWLLDYQFDYLFFTGSPATGRHIMQKAARNLCPVTLELGGKSPCIVSSSANIELAAKRIAFGKFINAGQTCVAPDYILVQKECKQALIDGLKQAINSFFGTNCQSSPHYGRILSDRFFNRLISLMNTSGGTIVAGGETDRSQRYIAPTLIEQPSLDSMLMQEEIFGPLLPILEYTTLDEAIAFVNAHNKPLALYYFGDKKEGDYVLSHTSSGGSCINDTILHVANKYLPFGGVGESGMGKYHGKCSFDLFSHHRAVVSSSGWFDLAAKYPPYKHIGVLKKIL